MLVDVIPIVRQFVPGLLKHARPSVVCVRTTHQKYLVFDADASRPACVVEIGEEERLRRTDGILAALHARCPATVPRPLVCESWGAGQVVHIQEGLAGLPWFRLADTLPTVAAWRSLLERTVAVMRRLHGAISAEPKWVGTVDVHDALCEQVRMFQATGSHETARLLPGLQSCVEELDGLPPMAAVLQHGDFSLNNLMVAPDTMAVIDFEEFGLTGMPLHDAIGLALSFPMSQDGRCPISLRDCVERCIGGPRVVRSFDDGVLRGLLLHHLLWRINRSRGLPARARLQSVLTSLAGRVATAPGNGLSGLTPAAS